MVKKMGVSDQNIVGVSALNALLNRMSAGDVLCVPTMASFAGGAYDMFRKLQFLSNRGIEFQSGNEWYLNFSSIKPLSVATVETVKNFAGREVEFVHWVKECQLSDAASIPLIRRIQVEALMEELGVEEIFTEKVSGKSQHSREELEKMLQYVRKGDVVVVESISRIARNTKDLLEIVEKLNEKHVDFTSRKEQIDINTPSGKFMLTVFGAIVLLKREYILDRQREGIEIARQNGKYKGRKPIAIDGENLQRCMPDGSHERARGYRQCGSWG